MKLRELPDWERPREKLLRKGAAALSNAEILALLLRTGTQTKTAMDLAGEILTLDSSGIRFLVDCSPEDLRRVSGMGDAKICELLAAVELGRRIASTRTEKLGKITRSDDLAVMFMERMRYYREEHFICLLLDARGEIIEETEVSVGNLTSTAADPREVFSRAIRRSAGCVALLHNHPSGDPSPSDEDLKITRRLARAGELVGIRVVDHIIIGDGEYASLRGMGIL